jgi:phosphoglycerate dehydrogenase-like enzyme
VTAATERGIYVANCRGSNADTVAELAIALMLNVSRVREGRWRSTDTEKLLSLLIGKEIARKTLGLVGMGAIGRRVARIAKGFEMRVLVFDQYLSSETITQAGAEPTDLSSVMREADYVSIHVPVSEETRGLISEKEISLMKPTAYLVCTARGNVVDEKALIRALRQKKIAGAGLDVFSIEPLPASSPITKLNNVVLTPHIGGATKEAIAEMARVTAEETVRIVQGEVPINLINGTQLATKGVRVQRAPQ